MAQSILKNIVIENLQDLGDLSAIKNLLPESHLIQSQQQNTSTRISIAKNQSRTLILGAIAIEIVGSIDDESVSNPSDGKTAKIAYVQVKKTWRKLRIGNALMKAAEELCCKEGGSRISMLLDVSNHAAHALTSLQKGWSNC